VILNTVETVELFAKYPHIAKKVSMSWGSPEGRKLLVSLLADSRDGARAGFPPSVAKEIFALLKQHDIKFPQHDTTTDIIVPFQGYREKIVHVRDTSNDFTVIKLVTKIILVIVILTLAVKGYNIFVV
jgi:hypothetical protein